MRPLVQRLKQRKLVQWALAYLAGAWLVLQVMDVVAGPFNVPDWLQQGLVLLLLCGLLGALILAWYHGERGRQAVSGAELLMLAALLGMTGVLLGTVGPARLASVSGGSGGSAPPASAASIVPLRMVLYDNPSVAILPFENMGPAEDQPFVDGLHDDVLTALQKISGLTVISRPSVLQYREWPKPVPTVARELVVDAVGMGSMSRSGGRIRVNVQVVSGESEEPLWADQFDRELTAENVFAVRTEIARAVARALRAELTPEEERRVAMRPTASLSAQDWVKIGATRIGPVEKIAAFRRAIEADSLYAPAWHALASVHWRMAYSWGAPPVHYDSAVLFSDRALALDPDGAEAYLRKGTALWGRYGRTTIALDLLRRATELDPGYARGWNNVGVLSEKSGRWEESLDAYWRAIRLTPSDPTAWANAASLYGWLGLDARANELMARGLEINPRDAGVLWNRFLLLASAGDLDSARAVAEHSLTLGPDVIHPRLLNAIDAALYLRDFAAAARHAERAYELAPDASGGITKIPLGLVRNRAGRAAEAARLFAAARTELESILAGGNENPDVFLRMAQITSEQGKGAEAVQWLQRAYDAGYRFAGAIDLDPMFDNLRGHPEFERTMARMRADVAEMRRRVLEMEKEAGLDQGFPVAGG